MSDRGDSIRSNVSDAYEKTPGYLVWDVTEAIGQEMDIQDDNIQSVEDKLDVDNLTGDELARFISQHKGITRKAATKAIGEVTVTGSGTVAVGDLFETSNGIQFSATEEVVIDATGTVPIEAVVAGNGGVVGSGTITQMPVTIAGISTVTNSNATADGFNAESDDDLRNRYYTALRTPVSSGNKHDYVNWAIEVTGVGGAEVFPLGHGDNTVDVVIIDADKKPASATLVTAVQNHIDPSSEGKGLGTAPIGAQCYVEAATQTTINISVNVTFATGVDVDAVKTAITLAVTKYLGSIAFAGNAVSYAQIGNAIIDTEGVLDYESLSVNGGTANIEIADRYVAVLGVITYD